jgi:hypothetical protein
MEVNDIETFQADSDTVKSHYTSNKNYIIEHDEANEKEYCIIYFSSNDLYFPNSVDAFTESIIKKNRYEWYKNRINKGHKHIFIRDIKKQWYLSGINGEIDSPPKLLNFLRRETIGYKIITIGSSAGGFMAVLAGQMLGAETTLSFNGQFEIASLLKTSSISIDPLVFRNQNSESLYPFYDVNNFIARPESIFYFYSNKSKWDCEQYEHSIKHKMNVIAFSTSNHGIPFLKSNLPLIINLENSELLAISGNTYHPLKFSMRMVGLVSTIKGIYSIVNYVFKKVYINLGRKKPG